MGNKLLIAGCSILLLVGCKNAKTESADAVISGMTSLAITINDNDLTIMVPDSTNGKIEIVEQSWGATEIKIGKGFQIAISEGLGDVTLKKSDVKADEVNKLKRFVKDEPSILFWESAITEPEFHFYMTEKVGTLSYIIEDIRELGFNEEEIQIMITAAKSIKLAAKSKS
ncbi:MAG: hypothetical protein ABI315_11470 [Bacteroidia bacterium]